ncbi:hybrid sensor histidine kinase/response regulator [Pseudoponticoccus marisrubri]|nr:PAS domain-containing hybrid sensor histidine kinase/response regulator [Pseudoponticoccus marisrubri]
MAATRRRIFTNNAAVRRGLASFVMALFVSAIVALVMDVRLQLERLASASSDNVQWTLSQGETDTMALEVALIRAASADEADRGAALDEVRLRFDVLFSRMGVLTDSAVFAPLRTEPEMARSLQAVTDYLDRHLPVIDGPDAALAAALPRMLDGVARLREPVRRIALMGVTHFSRISDAQRTSVSDTLFRIAVLTVTLVIMLVVVVITLFRLARERERESSLHREIRERMEAIIATSLDAVIVTDRHGRIVEYNGAAERVFGYPRAEAIGADMADLIVPDHLRARHVAGMRDHLERGRTHMIGRGIVQLEARRKSGEVFPVDLSLAKAQSRDGEIFVGFIRDISARVRAEDALRRARDQAVKGEKQKADLLAVMSHEMRTPLNGMLGTLDLIDTQAMDARNRRFLRIIRNSGRQLLTHVNDVLDISRLDAGKMSLRNTRFDLVALLTELVEGQAERARRHGNTLTLAPPSPVLHEVHGDPDRLQQILLNLVGNAIKFTENGRIRIETECHRGLHEVEIRVIDTGVGIAEEDLERIFGDFVTIDASYSRRSAGTGLGLGIAQRLANALGGRLGAESEPGDGSVFWLCLPLAPPPEGADLPAPPPEPGVVDPADLPPLRVLMVEDNEVNRLVAGELLRRDGHRVTDAHTGAEGVARARSDEYDVILMDISMPGMDGLEATRRIRAEGGASADAPIVATTAHALPDQVAEFHAAGMSGVLVKPLTAGALRAALLQAISGGDAPEAAPPVAAPAQETPVIDPRQLRELGADLPADKVEHALSTFAAEMRAFLNGGAPPSGDRAALAAEAHRMAGSAGVFGALRLAAELRALQEAAPAADPDELSRRRAALATCWRATAAEIERSGLVSLAGLDKG